MRGAAPVLRPPNPGERPRPVPKKRPAPLPKKPKAVANDEPVEESEDQNKRFKPRPPLEQNHELLAWLKDGNGKKEASLFAHAYLSRGRPYHGTAWPDVKPKIKDIGARWHPNEAKRDDTDGLLRGWWVAENENVLMDLLDTRLLPLSETKYGHKLVHSWRPVGVDEEEIQQILFILKLFEDYKTEKVNIERQRRADVNDYARRQAQAKDILADSPEDIALLKSKFDIEWTPVLALLSEPIGFLGPRMGLSTVARVLRGLKFGLISADDVRQHRFVDPWEIKYNRPSAMLSSDAPNGEVYERTDCTKPILTDYSKLPMTAPCLFFGDGPGMKTFPFSEMRAADNTASVNEYVAHTEDEFVCSIATPCSIQIQFGECNCKAEKEYMAAVARGEVTPFVDNMDCQP